MLEDAHLLGRNSKFVLLYLVCYVSQRLDIRYGCAHVWTLIRFWCLLLQYSWYWLIDVQVECSAEYGFWFKILKLFPFIMASFVFSHNDESSLLLVELVGLFVFLFNSVVGCTKNISILFVEYGINAAGDEEWIILDLLNLLWWQ